MSHAPTPAKRLSGIHLHYSGKSYSDAFQCPICLAKKRYNLNFLGSREPMCSGVGKFSLQARGPSQDARRQRIADALHEANHYREMAQDALDNGKLEDAEGWLNALTEEVTKALDPDADDDDDANAA